MRGDDESNSRMTDARARTARRMTSPTSPSASQTIILKWGKERLLRYVEGARTARGSKKRSGEVPAPQKRERSATAIAAATTLPDIREVVGQDLIEEPLARHTDAAAESIELVERLFVDEPRASYASSHAFSLTRPARAGGASVMRRMAGRIAAACPWSSRGSSRRASARSRRVRHRGCARGGLRSAR